MGEVEVEEFLPLYYTRLHEHAEEGGIKGGIGIPYAGLLEEKIMLDSMQAALLGKIRDDIKRIKSAR